MNINRYFIVFFLLIFFLGVGLRSINFPTTPRHGATFDEFAWTWLGINLIQQTVPISWSSHPHYKEKKHLIYQGAAFWIVKPYLEHPPLFGLIAGSFALLNGVKDMYHVTLERMRPLALALGAFSIFMVFLLTKEQYGKGIAILSSLLYATVPTIVIGSRIVQNENFLIPFWLLSLYLTLKYLKTGRKSFRNTAAVIAGLLSLAKVPWLVVGFSLSLILAYKRKLKDSLFVGIVTALFFSTFILYGIYFDKSLFLSLWGLQLARYDISFSGLFSIFTDPLLVDRRYLDGWIFFGWMSIILLAHDFKKHFLILIPFISYFVLYIFAIPNEPGHGWYRFPFYPFLLISLALILREELFKPTLRIVLFLFIVGLSLLYNTWQQSFGFSLLVYRLSIIIWSIPILTLISPSRKINVLSKIIIVISIMLFVILSIFSVNNFHD